MMEILNVIWALLFVLTIIATLVYIAKRTGLVHGSYIKNKQNRISIIEVKSLDTRNKLIIVSKDEKEYFLSLGSEGIHVIDCDNKKGGFKNTLENTNLTKDLGN